MLPTAGKHERERRVLVRFRAWGVVEELSVFDGSPLESLDI